MPLRVIFRTTRTSSPPLRTKQCVWWVEGRTFSRGGASRACAPHARPTSRRPLILGNFRETAHRRGIDEPSIKIGGKHLRVLDCLRVGQQDIAVEDHEIGAFAGFEAAGRGFMA
jgi:hypothetical protein